MGKSIKRVFCLSNRGIYVFTEGATAVSFLFEGVVSRQSQARILLAGTDSVSGSVVSGVLSKVQNVSRGDGGLARSYLGGPMRDKSGVVSLAILIRDDGDDSGAISDGGTLQVIRI